MAAVTSNGHPPAKPDRFYAVEIEPNAGQTAFDANQYSFFGDLDGPAGSALDGALEEGLEAPPEEGGLGGVALQLEGLGDEELGGDDDMPLGEQEDFSLATMFANRLGVVGSKSAAQQDEDQALASLLSDSMTTALKQAAEEKEQEIRMNSLFGSPSPGDRLGGVGFGSLLLHPEASPLSLSRTSLNATPLSVTASAAPLAFGGASPLYASQLELNQAAQQQQQQQSPASGAALLQMLKKPQQQMTPGKAVTAEELEAQLLQAATDSINLGPSPQQLQQQQQGYGHPGGMMPQGLMMPGGPGGMPPMGMGPMHMGPDGPYITVMGPHGPMPMPVPMPVGSPGGYPQGRMPPGPMGPPLHGMPPHMHMQPPGAMGGMPPPPHGGPYPGHPGMVPHQPGMVMMQHMGPGGPHMMGLQQHHPGGMQQGPGHMQQGPPPPPGPHGLMPGAGIPGGMVAVRPPPGPGGAPMMVMMSPQPGGHLPHHQLRGMPPGAPGGPHMGVGGPRPPAPPRPPPPQQPQQQHGGALPPQPPPPQPHPQQHPQHPQALGAAPAPRSRTATPPRAPLMAPNLHHGPGPASQQPAIAAAVGRPNGSEMMTREDVEYVVRAMLYNVASGTPYVEDYYYQAFIHKHTARMPLSLLAAGPSAPPFSPDALRDISAEDLAAGRIDPSVRVKFVNVEGLGKLAYSNIRTPKVLMDLSQSPGDKDAKADDDSGRPAGRRLDQEPLLAARLMIEDCMGLLMDVDDIDRVLMRLARVQGGQPVHPAQQAQQAKLLERRALLLTGITNSFQVQGRPDGSAAASAMDVDDDGEGAPPSSAVGDGVLLRIMALSKGRKLVARALLAITPPVAPPASAAAVEDGAAAAPPATPPYALLWAALRNAWQLFGPGASAADAAAEKALVEATCALAAAARDVISKMPAAEDVVAAAEAFAAGCDTYCSGLRQPASPMDHILPLAQTKVVLQGGAGSSGGGGGWLGDVLAALLRRAQSLDLHQAATAAAAAADGGSASGPGSGEAWARACGRVHARVAAHLEALQAIHSMAVESGSADALGVVKALTCRPLVQAMMEHCPQAQRGALRDIMLRFLPA